MTLPRLSIALFAFILSIGCGAEAGHTGEDPVDIVAKTVQVLKSELLTGMSRREVEEVLSRHHVEYSFIDAKQLEAEKNLPIPPSELAGRYVGIMRDLGGDFPFTKSISLEIDISRGGSLAWLNVEIIRTGP